MILFHSLSSNVGLLFYREKLPQYDIDLSFMFPITQDNCDDWKKNEMPESQSEKGDNEWDSIRSFLYFVD